MNNQFKDFLAIDLDKSVAPLNLVPSDQINFQNNIVKLKEIFRFIKKAADVSTFVDVPKQLLARLEESVTMFTEQSDKVNIKKEFKTTSEVASYYRQVFESILRYHSEFFEPSSNNVRLIALNSIINYGSELAEGFQGNLAKLVNDLETSIASSNNLFVELSNKSKSILIDNYAGVFEAEEKKHTAISRSWLTVGILATILFVIVFKISINHEWFPSTISMKNIVDGKTTTNEIFNYPLLISKYLIVSLIVFFIVFCFKQFSINKNLQIINQHRKNAINSYKLFEASLNRADTSSANLIMLQVAKAIYETVHTGYVGKGDSSNMSSQLIEMTKLGESK